MKAAIYARTASVNASTLDQIEICREYIQDQGGKVIGIYDDQGASPDELPRDGLGQFLFDATTGRYDTFVVVGQDRIYHNKKLLATFIIELELYDISLVVVKKFQHSN